MTKRIVIRAPNWLGDAVMALPAMGAIRDAFGGAHVAIAAIPSVAPIFEEITSARQNNILKLSGATEAQVMASGQFDAAVLLPNSFRSAWSAARASIPQRWGYASDFRGMFLTRAVAKPRGRVHQSAYYLELVRGLEMAASADELPQIAVTPETAARASKMLADRNVPPDAQLVGFAPGAAYGHAKRWPPKRVAELITRLWRERRSTSVLFGAEGDRDAGREIESSLPPDVRVVNLIARTDLRLLAGLIARCTAFVSNDSGAMHLAAALSVPLAAIFGPTDDRVTAPLGHTGTHDVLIHSVFCRPCMLRDCPIDHRCMKGITVDAVFASVARRLEVIG